MSILPTGWERVITPDGLNAGRPYYVNHNDGTTHWDPPDPPDAAGSSHSSHPVVTTEASTALVPTHPHRHTHDGGVQQIRGAGLYLLRCAVATLWEMITQAPGQGLEHAAWHNHRNLSLGHVCQRVEPDPTRHVRPRVEPDPREPSKPVANKDSKEKEIFD